MSHFPLGLEQFPLTHDRISFLTYFFVIRVPRSAPLDGAIGKVGLADPLCMENER